MELRSPPDHSSPPVADSRTCAAAAVVALGAGALAATPAQAADPPVAINLVTINDFHGRIEAGGTVGGSRVLASAVKESGPRTRTPCSRCGRHDRCIDVHLLHPGGQPDDRHAQRGRTRGERGVGNHEFDQGWDDLSGRVPPGEWEYLAANVYDKTGQARAPGVLHRDVQGVTVGFIGAVTNELPSLVSPDGIAEPRGPRPQRGANGVADQLSDGDAANGEADVVVLLVHEGAAQTRSSRRRLEHAVRRDRQRRRRQGQRDRLGSHPPRVQPRDPYDGGHRSPGHLGGPVRREVQQHGHPGGPRHQAGPVEGQDCST